ncbi:MAG TPA: quinol:cytochrome C oxidoreductase [Pirellulaceae bacterium]|nr:quinol:cytochrome C oxidoreductase [Pirellulaceae bacterium]
MGTTARRTATSPKLTLGPVRAPLLFGGLAVGVVGVAAAFFAAGGQTSDGLRDFLASYLVAFCFFMSISLGGLFWVIVMHLTRAGWGVAIRRLAEILAMAAFPGLVLFLPILIPVMIESPSAIYDWVAPHPRLAPFADLLEHKSGYLNGSFFGIRSIAYFILWGAMARYFLAGSRRQDETNDPSISLRMQGMAAPAMLLFAFTIVFASFDWEMSVEPIWFSTIFPVYFFAGAAMSSVCTLILLSYLLQRVGRLTEDVTTEHYHDLSKLAFGFVFFWGYIAFSQYLLIWYANLPEETVWFRSRQTGGWATASIVLMVLHLFLPFLAVMPRTLRRNKHYMALAACVLLVAHWFDHFWLVMPTYRPEFSVSAVEILCWIGLGGFYVSAVSLIAGDRKLVPVGDPRLVESLNYHNA